MLLITIFAAKYMSIEETIKQWLQSRYACGYDDGISFNAGPDSNVG